MRQKRFIFLAIGSALLILPLLLYHLLVEGHNYYYEWVELPVVRREADQTPGIQYRGVRNFGVPGEPSFEVILGIESKGTIALYTPTRQSFTGGGPITFGGIGDCVRTPVISVAAGSSALPGIELNTIADLPSYYDQIYTAMHMRGYCSLRDARGPIATQP